MTKRPKLPADFDENPPLDGAFFSNAASAREEAALLREVLSGENAEERKLRAVVSHLVTAHSAGLPLHDALDEARAFIAAK